MADPIEIRNWVDALGLPKGEFPYINAPKSMTGHCIGAAGAVESIGAILELSEQFIHPTINHTPFHPEIEMLIPLEKIPNKEITGVKINHVAKASFGFGDVNTCLIFKANNKKMK